MNPRLDSNGLHQHIAKRFKQTIPNRMKVLVHDGIGT